MRVYPSQFASRVRLCLACGAIACGVIVALVLRSRSGPPDAAPEVVHGTLNPVLALVSGMPDVSDAVTRWASSWTPPADRQEPEQRAHSSKDALLSARLSSANLFRVAAQLDRLGDVGQADVWYSAAIDQVEREWATYPRLSFTEAEAVRSVLEPARRGLGSARAFYWAHVDGRQEERITSLASRLPRANADDPEPEWIRIDHAESLYLLERPAEARREMNAVVAQSRTAGSKGLTVDQMIGVNWLEGLLYQKERNFAGASRLYELVANSRDRHSNDALELLTECLALSGQQHAASAKYGDWVVRTRPSFSTAIRLSAEVIWQASYRSE